MVKDNLLFVLVIMTTPQHWVSPTAWFCAACFNECYSYQNNEVSTSILGLLTGTFFYHTLSIEHYLDIYLLRLTNLGLIASDQITIYF